MTAVNFDCYKAAICPAVSTLYRLRIRPDKSYNCDHMMKISDEKLFEFERDLKVCFNLKCDLVRCRTGEKSGHHFFLVQETDRTAAIRKIEAVHGRDCLLKLDEKF